MLRRITFRALPALLSAAVLLVVGSSVIGSSAANAAVTAHKAAAATTVTVSAVDFKFKLSATSIKKPGTVNFKVTNNGHTSHDFSIGGKTTKLLSPGKSATLTVKFAKKGSFYYECTVPGHAALGMKGYFKVA
jgi:uncharacterized cupredoxin-like copper-binding protein